MSAERAAEGAEATPGPGARQVSARVPARSAGGRAAARRRVPTGPEAHSDAVPATAPATAPATGRAHRGTGAGRSAGASGRPPVQVAGQVAGQAPGHAPGPPGPPGPPGHAPVRAAGKAPGGPPDRARLEACDEAPGRAPDHAHPEAPGEATGGTRSGRGPAAGRPHGGKRRYGYTPDGMRLVPHEAAIIREVFRRYLAGDSPATIARDLDTRGERTALDASWTGHTVLDLLDSHHVVGIRVSHGREVGGGAWPAVVDRAVWEEVRERRRVRAAALPAGTGTSRRFYLLRGLVVCRACGTRMGGSGGSYLCNRGRCPDGTACGRRISARSLEAHVESVVLDVLEHLTPPPSGPAADLLGNLAGPGAARAWDTVRQAGDLPRLNAVLRHVVADVLVDEASTRGRRFDPGRVEIRLQHS